MKVLTYWAGGAGKVAEQKPEVYVPVGEGLHTSIMVLLGIDSIDVYCIDARLGHQGCICLTLFWNREGIIFSIPCNVGHPYAKKSIREHQ